MDIINILLEASRESLNQLRPEVSNIHYGPIKGESGTILFDFRGATYEIPEPMDVCISGTNMDAERSYCLMAMLGGQANRVE